MINKSYLHKEYSKERKRIKAIVDRLEKRGIDASAYIPPKISETSNIDLGLLDELSKVNRKSILREMYTPSYTNVEQIRQAIVDMEQIILPIEEFAKFKSKYLYIFDQHYEEQFEDEYDTYISENSSTIKEAIKGVEMASDQETFEQADAELIYLLNYSEQVSMETADQLWQIETAGYIYE